MCHFKQQQYEKFNFTDREGNVHKKNITKSWQEKVPVSLHQTFKCSIDRRQSANR